MDREMEYQEGMEQDASAREPYQGDERADSSPIFGFLTMNREELLGLSAEEAPDLCEADLFYLQSYARSEHRPVTYGQLRLTNALVAVRRSSAENYTLGDVYAKDGALLETYADLTEKASVLGAGGIHPQTLEEYASVSPQYMRRIGRGDDGAPLDRITGEAPLPVGSAFVLISPLCEEDEPFYGQRLRAMLEDGEIRALFRRSFQVGKYGLLGTLCNLCGGVFADLRLLPMGETAPLTTLVSGYRGRGILCGTREAALWICRLAERFSLRADYFAKATDTGRWRTSRDLELSVDWSYTFLMGLMGARERRSVTLPATDLKTFCANRSVPMPLSIPHATVALSLETCPESNSFAHAMNTAIDAVIGIVSRGVDRRGIGLSVSYRFGELEGAEMLEEGLSAILGIYRVTAELALPQYPPRFSYSGAGRSVTCTAYSTARQLLPLSATGKGDTVCLLTFGRRGGGLPDFDSLRKVCDRFTELCREGKVYAAKAVRGLPEIALREMTEAFETVIEADFSDGASCQGILLEMKAPTELPVVARLCGRRSVTEENPQA